MGGSSSAVLCINCRTSFSLWVEKYSSMYELHAIVGTDMYKDELPVLLIPNCRFCNGTDLKEDRFVFHKEEFPYDDKIGKLVTADSKGWDMPVTVEELRDARDVLKDGSFTCKAVNQNVGESYADSWSIEFRPPYRRVGTEHSKLE